MEPEAHKETPRHELSDANVRRLVQFGIGTAILLLAGYILSALVFSYFVHHQSLGKPASPFENVRTLPPEPRLQVTPLQDLASYRAQQEQTLHSYGWVDRKNGVVRIPIERAMDLLIQRGLPARPPGQAPLAGVPGRRERGDFAPPAQGEPPGR